MNKKIATPSEKEAALIQLRDQYKGLDTDTQCRRIFAALQLGTLDTCEARKYLDVLHPAGRVQQLRKQGHEILTLRVPVKTESGIKHSVGRYVLISTEKAVNDE